MGSSEVAVGLGIAVGTAVETGCGVLEGIDDGLLEEGVGEPQDVMSRVKTIRTTPITQMILFFITLSFSLL